MSDMIKRSDAIEAIEIVDWYHINRNGDLVSGARSDGTALYKAADVYKALKEVPSADRPQGEWIDKAISIIDDMQREGIIDYEQAREYRMRAKMKGADDE